MSRQMAIESKETPCPLKLPSGRTLAFERPLVMGVLNVTPDSFSDGGRFNTVASAVERAFRMADEGADIIDIGGESSRPGAEPVRPDIEQSRVLPVLKEIRRQSDIPVSIDTYHSDTAARAVENGADIINDISAMRFDRQMTDVVSRQNIPVILMHMQGTPRDMQKEPFYEDCVREICDFFIERIEHCRTSGIESDKIILDPGIGFGKRLEDNLAILANLREFTQLGQPLLVGASRKSFIGALRGDTQSPDKRLGGSITAAVTAVANGASIVRVHDVAETVEALNVAGAIEGRA